MKKLDPTKIVTNGQGSHGTAKKLTVRTHVIKSCRERLKIKRETEVEISPPLCLVGFVRAVRVRRLPPVASSPSSFDNKLSRKKKRQENKIL